MSEGRIKSKAACRQRKQPKKEQTHKRAAPFGYGRRGLSTMLEPHSMPYVPGPMDPNHVPGDVSGPMDPNHVPGDISGSTYRCLRHPTPHPYSGPASSEPGASP